MVQKTSVFYSQSRHKQRVLTSTNRVKYGRTFVQYTFSGPAGLIPSIE
ncbi:hypothetical protein Hgul01_05051 [Herpetosiphon gulosus]|uniref:Uncharacterized protein n=1 Tax=Herpetosiphon gulosus TaxID=1973496 RepID=A0ABP9X770_9CHLR